jgi:lactoylglutathione lyase
MPSYLHTCYRIGDIDRSVAFYEKLGFEETWRMPIGDEAINVFMSLPGESPVLELTYNHGVDSYELGTGYNHIALAVEDLDGTLAGDRAREAALPPGRPYGGLAHLLRARPRRLPGRAGRNRRVISGECPPVPRSST